MNTVDLAAIDNLVPQEKLALLERLWASLVCSPGQLPISPGHLQLVRQRLAEHAADPSDVVAVSDAMAAVRGQLR